MTHPSERLRGGPMHGLAGARRLFRSRSGATAVEFALVALPFCMMIFGIIEFSRLIWTQSALQFAVERAARCAAVNPSTCGTPDQIATYAASQMLAPGIASSAFSYAAVTCGSKVSATAGFTFIATGLLPPALTLTAQSCYPT